jgi:hypothetical protein
MGSKVIYHKLHLGYGVLTSLNATGGYDVIIGNWDSEADPLVTPGEVAKAFRVNPKTVTRWSKRKVDGLPSIKTPGGHRRYRKSHLDALLRGEQAPSDFFA